MTKFELTTGLFTQNTDATEVSFSVITLQINTSSGHDGCAGLVLPHRGHQQQESTICVFYHHRALLDKRGVNYIKTTTFKATDGKKVADQSGW